MTNTVIVDTSGGDVIITTSGGTAPTGVLSVNGDSSSAISLIQILEAEAVQSHSLATPQNALTGTITVPQASIWLVDISCGFTINTTNQDFSLEVLLDGASISSNNSLLIREEQKDAAGTSTGALLAAGISTDQIHRAFSRHRIALNADATVDVLFGGDGNEVSIFDLLVVATRVS